jgi:hypothetical protein
VVQAFFGPGYQGGKPIKGSRNRLSGKKGTGFVGRLPAWLLTRSFFKGKVNNFNIRVV